MTQSLINIGTLACCNERGGQSQLHIINKAAVVWDKSEILWIGEEKNIPGDFRKAARIDAKSGLVIPGLIDCHTHLAFAGWRADEFEQRLGGKSYLEIAQAGGGILSTVAKTRAAGADELVKRCSSFLTEMAALGVTCVEAKSGYGLNLESELKLLEVYKKLNQIQPLEIVPTFLGAHTVPAEFKESRDEYLKLITEEMIPKVAAGKLAKFCDVFLEDSAFSYSEARMILEAGKKLGLIPKMHADQLSDKAGAKLAAELEAASADHLEHISDAGIQALAESQTVAVLLPFASLYTKQPFVDASRLIKAGAQVAVATDFNPGSAPSYHLPFCLSLSCNLNGLTPAQALKGATIYAAKALQIEDRVGSIEVGKQADLAVIEAEGVSHWLYHLRSNACKITIKAGQLIF